MEGLRNFAVWLLIFGLVGVYSQHHGEPETGNLAAEVGQSVGDLGTEVLKTISEKPNKRVRRLDYTHRRAQPASPSSNNFQGNQQGGQQGGLPGGGRARTGRVGPGDLNAARNAAAAANAANAARRL